jgi:hypothetical protein
VIWLFERGEDVVRLETRIDPSTDEYLIDIVWANSAPAMERYKNHTAFTVRILELEKQLASEHWSQASDSPQLIAAAWRGPFSS